MADQTAPVTPATQPPAATPEATKTPETTTTPPVPEVNRIARAIAAIEAGQEKGDGDEEAPKTEAPPATEPKKEETPPATPATETPPSTEEPKPEVAEKEARLGQKIAEVTRREAALTAKESELKAKEDKALSFEQTLKDIKDTPTKLLEMAGITFQELADAIIAEKSTPDPVKKELKELRKEMTELKTQTQAEKDAEKKAAEERTIAEQDEFIKTTTENYKKMIGEHIEKEKDTFELVHSLGAQDLVWDIIETYWEKNQKIMGLEQACQLAEDYLVKRAEKMLTTKKLQTKKTPDNSTKPPRTLTNSISSGSPERNDSLAHLSTDERAARAASLLRFD